MTKEKFSPQEHEKSNEVSLDARLVDILRTFRDFLLIEHRRAVNTVESYGRDVESFFCWLQENGDVSPANWSKSIVIDYLRDKREQGKSDTTLRRHLASIRALARLLVRDGYASRRILRLTSCSLRQMETICPKRFRKKRCPGFCWHPMTKRHRRFGTGPCSSFCTRQECASAKSFDSSSTRLNLNRVFVLFMEREINPGWFP